MNKPKYNRCDYCGRNAHKVAVRNPRHPVERYDGTIWVPESISGYCPSCWGADDDYHSTLPSGARSQSGVLKGDRYQATILYDRRKKKVGY